MAQYRVADQARDDLDEFWRYTAVEWSVDQAELLNQRFHDRFQTLAEQPGGGRSRPDLGSDLRGVPLLRAYNKTSGCHTERSEVSGR